VVRQLGLDLDLAPGHQAGGAPTARWHAACYGGGDAATSAAASRRSDAGHPMGTWIAGARRVADESNLVSFSLALVMDAE
jgi:hypothetical protein